MAIHDRMNCNDLCWIRDSDSIYYLGRITSKWSYQNTHEYKRADVVNIRECMWQRVDLDAVPGKIIASFIPSRTVQEIHDDRARMYSRYLWNKITSSMKYEVGNEKWDIFMRLDYEETEDLIFLYLQSEGWYVVPNSRRGNTMKYEFYVVNPQTRERGVIQVKTGEEVLNREEFRTQNPDTKVFLFQSNELYVGETDRNIICILRKELLEFLNEAIPRNWLPGWLQTKWEMVNRSDP